MFFEHKIPHRDELPLHLDPTKFLAAFVENVRSSPAYHQYLERIVMRLAFDIVNLNQLGEKTCLWSFTTNLMANFLPSNQGIDDNRLILARVLTSKFEALMKSVIADIISIMTERGYDIKLDKITDTVPYRIVFSVAW